MDAKAQVEILMNELLGFAEKMLAEDGEFHPFGGYLRDATEVVHVGLAPVSGFMSATERLDGLIGAFKRLTDEASAFGIVSDRGDAVQIFLEHRDGYCADVYFRYTLATDRGVEITETVACMGEPIFFSSPLHAKH